MNAGHDLRVEGSQVTSTHDMALHAGNDMTLTSAACPLTDVIERQAQMVRGPFSETVTVNWVWLPPWGPECITPDGRAQLRAIGFNV